MKKLVLTGTHRSLYGSLSRELWQDVMDMQEEASMRPVTDSQSRALVIAAAMLDRLGTRTL